MGGDAAGMKRAERDSTRASESVWATLERVIKEATVLVPIQSLFLLCFDTRCTSTCC